MYYNLVNYINITYAITKMNISPKFHPTHQNSCEKQENVALVS